MNVCSLTFSWEKSTFVVVSAILQNFPNTWKPLLKHSLPAYVIIDLESQSSQKAYIRRKREQSKHILALYSNKRGRAKRTYPSHMGLFHGSLFECIFRVSIVTPSRDTCKAFQRFCLRKRRAVYLLIVDREIHFRQFYQNDIFSSCYTD